MLVTAQKSLSDKKGVLLLTYMLLNLLFGQCPIYFCISVILVCFDELTNINPLIINLFFGEIGTDYGGG